MTCKKATIRVEGAQIDIIRKLRTSNVGPYVEDTVIVQINGKKKTLHSISLLFEYVERILSRRIVREIYRALDRLDLCIRCGYCCTTGAPPISMSDAERLATCPRVVNTVLDIVRDRELAYITFVAREHIDPETLFVLWNALLDFLRPCPFLEISNSNTQCTIYEIKPEFCTLFKCWSPYTEHRRRLMFMTILRQLERSRAHVGDSKLRRLAQLAEEKTRTLLYLSQGNV